MSGLGLAERAKSAGLEFVTVGDRIEARKGNKVIAFHTTQDKAAQKALERLEEERLRNVDPRPEDREPVLRVRKKATPIVLTPAPEAPAVEIVDLQPETAPTKVIKGSIISKKYVDRYKKTGYSCGDILSEEIREYIMVIDQGRAHIDLKKLRQIADDNGVWRDSYVKLNPGQQRMNIGNRIRAKYKNGERIMIGGAPFEQEFRNL